MSILSNKIPPYIYEKSNIIRLVLFTSVFAVIFINIYKPFSSDNWYPVSETRYFGYSLIIVFTGALVLSVSRVLLYRYSQKQEISYGKYILWIGSEIFIMSLFYTLYTIYVTPREDAIIVFREAARNTSLILLLPFSVSWLYFSWKEKEQQLKQLEQQPAGVPVQINIIPFRDEKGILRLSVKRNNLLYIESADNYVIIWYLNKSKITKFLLRNTLKSLEAYLNRYDIIRCHRSYMINLDQVKVMRREKDGIYLELGMENVPDIPISRTYSEKVTRRFTAGV